MARSSKSRLPSLGPAFLALGTILSIVFLGLSQLEGMRTEPLDISIPLRSQNKAAILVTISRGGTPGMVEFRLKSGTGVEMTLPPTWTLREVRGMDLAGITSAAPTRSGRTWSITGKGTASFWAGEPPRSFQLRNRGTAPLALTVRQVFVREGRIDEQEYLVTDRPVQVW